MITNPDVLSISSSADMLILSLVFPKSKWGWCWRKCLLTWNIRILTHHSDVIMSGVTSEITGVLIVYSTVFPSADQRKHQSSASLAFVKGIHRWEVNSPHNGPVTWKMLPFCDVIMKISNEYYFTVFRDDKLVLVYRPKQFSRNHEF